MSSKYLTILPAIAAALLLAACSKDDMAELDTTLSNGAYPLEIGSVSITAEVSDDPMTRVSESSDRASSVFEDGEKINVQIGGGTPGTYTYNSANGSWTVATDDSPAYWLSAVDGQTITAWYVSDETDGTVDLSDQSNDLAYVLQAVTTADFNESATLSFTHQLAKVRVVFSEGTFSLTDATVCVSAPVSCTVSQGSVTDTGEIDLIKMCKATYESTTCWEANVPANTTINSFTITGSNTLAVCATDNFTTTAGQISTVTLTVNNYE